MKKGEHAAFPLVSDPPPTHPPTPNKKGGARLRQRGLGHEQESRPRQGRLRLHCSPAQRGADARKGELRGRRGR